MMLYTGFRTEEELLMMPIEEMEEVANGVKLTPEEKADREAKNAYHRQWQRQRRNKEDFAGIDDGSNLREECNDYGGN